MFSSVSNKSIMLIKPSMIRALSAQAAPAAVSSSNKVRILCFGFSHNPLRFSLARETDTKMTRANHSMAMGNLNKRKETTPTTSTTLKDHFPQELKSPLSDLTSLNFQKLFPMKYEVNLAAQSSHSDTFTK